MHESILSLVAAFRVFFRSRSDSALEILALRQQLAVFKRKRPRPQLNRLDRFFWTTLRGVWSRWADALIIEVLSRIASHPITKLTELLPHNWASARA